MRTINIIILLFALSINYGQAQSTSKSSKQKKTIEINNDNGDLYISFVNGEISEFTVNDEAVPKHQYVDYQNILDEFSGEEQSPTPPVSPAPPAPPIIDENDQNEQLQTQIKDYLIAQNVISSTKKIKVQLKSTFLKVNGKKLNSQAHQDCLGFFEDIYGHELNERSEVKFKRSRKNSSSSIKIAK